MSKKVNFTTMNQEVINMFSNFSVAKAEIKALKDKRNTELSKAESLEAEILEKRKAYQAEGHSLDEAIAMHSLEEANNIRRKAESDYSEAVKPFNDAMKEAYAQVPDSVYWAYALTLSKKSLSAKGTFEVKKGKKVEVHDVPLTFKAECAKYARFVGAKDTENEAAVNKYAEALFICSGGAKYSNKAGEFIKAKSMNEFKKLFVASFIQVCLDRHALQLNEDNTISRYEKKEA